MITIQKINPNLFKQNYSNILAPTLFQNVNVMRYYLNYLSEINKYYHHNMNKNIFKISMNNSYYLLNLKNQQIAKMKDSLPLIAFTKDNKNDYKAIVFQDLTDNTINTLVEKYLKRKKINLTCSCCHRKITNQVNLFVDKRLQFIDHHCLQTSISDYNLKNVYQSLLDLNKVDRAYSQLNQSFNENLHFDLNNIDQINKLVLSEINSWCEYILYDGGTDLSRKEKNILKQYYKEFTEFAYKHFLWIASSSDNKNILKTPKLMDIATFAKSYRKCFGNIDSDIVMKKIFKIFVVQKINQQNQKAQEEKERNDYEKQLKTHGNVGKIYYTQDTQGKPYFVSVVRETEKNVWYIPVEPITNVIENNKAQYTAVKPNLKKINSEETGIRAVKKVPFLKSKQNEISFDINVHQRKLDVQEYHGKAIIYQNQTQLNQNIR